MVRFFFIFLFFSATFVHAQNLKKNTLDCDDFFTLVKDTENAFLFDLREKAAFDECRIVDALSADSKENLKTYLLEIKKSDPIFIYCDHGIRSKQCFKWLKSLGYKKVYQLKGGIKNWKDAGFPLDSAFIH
jgi:rhodanese-related sulfurtransferase